MKKIFIIISIIIGLIIASNIAYQSIKKKQQTTTLTDESAVLNVYINLKPEDLELYFNLSDSDKIGIDYYIECDVPEHSQLNLINNRSSCDLDNINCDQTFNFNTQFEMKKKYQSLGYRLRIKLIQKSNEKILAFKFIYTPWEYGKVNHLVVSNDQAYLYCSN